MDTVIEREFWLTKQNSCLSSTLIAQNQITFCLGAAAQKKSFERRKEISDEPNSKRIKIEEAAGDEIKTENVEDDDIDQAEAVTDDELLEIITLAHQENQLYKISNDLRKKITAILK